VIINKTKKLEEDLIKLINTNNEKQLSSNKTSSEIFDEYLEYSQFLASRIDDNLLPRINNYDHKR